MALANIGADFGDYVHVVSIRAGLGSLQSVVHGSLLFHGSARGGPAGVFLQLAIDAVKSMPSGDEGPVVTEDDVCREVTFEGLQAARSAKSV